MREIVSPLAGFLSPFGVIGSGGGGGGAPAYFLLLEAASDKLLLEPGDRLVLVSGT